MTYTITCTGQAGSVSASATVTVVAPPAPMVTLSANPTSITAGGTSTLTYSSTNATSCTGTNFSVSGISASAVVLPTATTTHAITCTGGRGLASASASVTVTPARSPTSIIPADRITLWQPGVTYNGGIPTNRTVHVTLSPLGNGQDDTPQIQAALDSCPQNHVVLLNPGVFNITGNGLSFRTSNCTLRGSGLSPAGATGGNLAAEIANTPDFSQTHLQPTGGGTYLLKADRATNPSYGILYIGNNPADFSTSINLAADAVKDTNTLTLQSNPGIQVGELVLVDILTDNDPDVFWGFAHDPPGGGSRRWFMRQDRSINQILKVTAVNGNTLTFETPFHITFPVAYQAQLSRYNETVLTGVGVEDIGFMGGMGGDWHGDIAMNLCQYCWIKHVEAYWAGGTTIGLYGTYRSEVRDSYIHESSYPEPGGGGYLLGLNYGASDNLIENNIMWNGNKVDVMRATGGGNVLAYNYTDDAWGFTYPQWPEAGINAGHYTTPHFELIEGNYSQNYKGDAYWGNSIYITVFRNWLSGLRAAHGSLSSYTYQVAQCTYRYGDWDARFAVDVQAHSFNTNFVGNILGMPNQQLLSYNSNSCFDSAEVGFAFEDLDNSITVNDVIMWHMGDYQNTTGWVWDSTTYQTQLRQGNWDWYTKTESWLGLGGTQATPLGSAQTIPDSMYLTSKPAFFGSNPWPWIDPSTGTAYTLPAKARFDAGTPNTVQ
jgi:hypothetical protein